MFNDDWMRQRATTGPALRCRRFQQILSPFATEGATVTRRSGRHLAAAILARSYASHDISQLPVRGRTAASSASSTVGSDQPRPRVTSRRFSLPVGEAITHA